MFRALLAFVAWTPTGLGPFEAVRARLTWRSLLILVGVLLVQSPVALALGSQIWMNLPFLVLYGLSLVLVRGGYQQLAALVVTSLWIGFFVVALGSTGGIRGGMMAFVWVAAAAAVVWLDRVPAVVMVSSYLMIVLLHEPISEWWSPTTPTASSFESVAMGHVVALVIGTAISGTLLDALAAEEARADQRARAARVALVEAEEVMGASSRFLATMSHELRTPFNAILGYAELLEEDGSSNPDLRHIRTTSTHLLGLIDDILEVARREATSRSRGTSDLVGVIRSLGQRPDAPAIDLSCPHETLQVACESEPLTRILENLCRVQSPEDEVARLRVELVDERVTVDVLVPPRPGLPFEIAARLARSQGSTVESRDDGYRLVLSLS